LSSQITAATQSLETTRSRARRIKALWTLYTTVTYLLYTLIIALVLGPQKWAIPHYAGLAGAPLVIYGVRRAMQVFFDWRISQQQTYIEALQKQRDAKIADLKKATRYDSTQELLQKYGGAGKPAPSKSHQQQTQQGTKRKITPTGEPQRTGLPPPPTANIPGRTIGPAPSTPLRQNVDTMSPISTNARSPLLASALIDSPAIATPDEPGFAPNAFPNPPQQARPAYEQPSKWYDRILDVLLGEDETLAKNRIVLICTNCRLVNGQAPPGVKSLKEVGRWKCGGCGAWNGVESEVTNLMQEMRQKVQNEQVEGGEGIDKGRKEEATPPQVDGGTQLNIHEADDVQKPAREIPNSEDDTEDEDVRSEDGKDDGNEDIKSDERRSTRSGKKRSANKRK
jgi:hypothetical protein